MKGLFLKCPWKECEKLLLKNAYLRPGSFFTIRCYHCGAISTIRSDNGQVTLQIEKLPEGFNVGDDDEDQDVVTLTL